MTERTLISWKSIFDSMPPNSREAFATVAVRQLNRAKSELARGVADIIQGGKYPNYPPGQAPRKIIHLFLMLAMEKHKLEHVVIPLWVEGSSKVIAKLQQSAEARGLRFGTDLLANLTPEGLFCIPEFVPMMLTIAEECADHVTGFSRCHYQLAAYWLCGMQLTEEEWIAEQNRVDQAMTETGSIVSTLTSITSELESAASKLESMPPAAELTAIDLAPIATEPVAVIAEPASVAAEPAAVVAEPVVVAAESASSSIESTDSNAKQPLPETEAVSDRVLQDWSGIFSQLDENYRETVVDIALRQVSRVLTEPFIMAASIFKDLEIKGFRSGKAPHHVVRQHTLRLVNESTAIALPIMMLWADACKTVITELQTAAEAKGLRFKSPWPEISFEGGFYADEWVDPLLKVAKELSEGATDIHMRHLHLAAYWLSAAIIIDEEQPAAQESAPPVAAPVAEESAAVATPATDTATSPDPGIVPESSAAAPSEAAPSDSAAAVRRSRIQEIRDLADAHITPTDSLQTIREHLQSDLWSMEKMRQNIQPDLQAAIKASEASNLSYAEECFDSAYIHIGAWRLAFESLLKDTDLALGRLAHEVEIRPGISEGAPQHDIPDLTPEYARVKAIATEFIQLIDHMLDYDHKRESALQSLAQRRAQLLELQAQLAVWPLAEPLDLEHLWPPYLESPEVELQELQEVVAQTAAAIKRRTEHKAQLRAASEAHLAALIDQLRQAQVPADTLITTDFTLDELLATRLARLPDQQIVALENTLTETSGTLLAEAKENKVSALAARLRADWNEDLLLKLLSRLVNDHRAAEAALMFWCSLGLHPPADSWSLSTSLVRGLVTGLGRLAPPNRPFDLLSWLIVDLSTGWSPADARAQAAWGIALLGAHYGASMDLSLSAGWQLSTSGWPFNDTPGWSKLWHAAQAGQPLPPLISNATVRQQRAVNQERLAKARSQLDKVFARDNGWLPRLHTLRSKRHVKLLSQYFTSQFVRQLTPLKQLDAELEKLARSDRAARLVRLDKLTGEWSDGLSDEYLQAEYEKVVLRENLSDSDPVQRRAALKVLHDCSFVLVEYGEALAAYWRAELEREGELTQEQLETELAVHADLVALGQTVLQVLIDGTYTPAARDEVRAQQLAQQQIETRLLTEAVYVLHLPRMINCLTRESLNRDQLWPPLLNDLAEPLPAEEVAALLLEMESPDQALLLAAHLPIEQQKQAQAVRIRLEQTLSELQTEVIKLGGEVDDLAPARQLGRWRYARHVLQQRLAELQAVAAAEQQQRAEQALTLRRWINELDEAVFQVKETLPLEVYTAAEHGLSAARRAGNDPALLDEVRTFLQEIDYRLKHQAWPSAAKMQEAVDFLDYALSGAQTPGKAALTAEDVLNLLEQEDLTSLGPAAHHIESSAMGTRADLLRNWLRVRSLPAFLSEELTYADRNAIQALFRHFARMMSMRRVLAESTGKPLEFEDPAVYAYYELRHPKTDALRSACVFVALPGHPPRPDDIAQLQNLMDDKAWLEDSVVFLFVPGCTPALVRRLTARRLVVVNEATMLDWVLAETKYLNPLSRLRPRLLNAIGAANVEVFKINQLVNSRTGIFVGREHDVERIANSDANFAIYGGRRIGKSSLLKSIEETLRDRKVRTEWLSIEGQADLSDDAIAVRLARQVLGSSSTVKGMDDLKPALHTLLDSRPDLNLVLFIDEIDKYIVYNPARHVLIEALRSLSNYYPGRCRTIVSGFTDLYDCLKGRGPYSPTSDPWRRMFNDLGGPLGNLLPESAEKIVGEGFIEVLGWEFEKRAVPQLIVERTGSHPAFIQKFCLELQQRVAARADGCVRLSDIDAVFADDHPERSFIAYVQDSLKDNLDPISRYLVLWLAREAQQQRGFTWDEAREIIGLLNLGDSEALLERSLERLKVTSVVKERSAHLYEFSVPDYPLILTRLGETLINFNQLEREIGEGLERPHGHAR